MTAPDWEAYGLSDVVVVSLQKETRSTPLGFQLCTYSHDLGRPAVFEIKPGSIAESCGTLRLGDVVVEVNGVPCSADADGKASALIAKAEGDVLLTLRRKPIDAAPLEAVAPCSTEAKKRGLQSARSKRAEKHGSQRNTKSPLDRHSAGVQKRSSTRPHEVGPTVLVERATPPNAVDDSPGCSITPLRCKDAMTPYQERLARAKKANANSARRLDEAHTPLAV
tara:strand:+ start:360 stop:1028 length:669 start_codon:yes stop_codon:yes gene_type:complete